MVHRYLYPLLFLPFLATVASAQSLSLFNIDASGFPRVSANFYAFDGSGSQVTPGIGEMSLLEEGAPRPILSIDCPAPAPPRALSSVLVVDVSGSMAQAFRGGLPNIDLARAAARAWVDGLPLGASECAVTSFDNLNYLNQDFTTDAGRLHSAIDRLIPMGGTDYDMGLLRSPAGGLYVSRNGRNQKVIVFLSDGFPQQIPDVDAIVAEAQAQNCIIFAVTLQMPCPSFLREIADRTGGTWTENVTSVDEAVAVYRNLLRVARSNSPCTITWDASTCMPLGRSVELGWSGERSAGHYTAPDAGVASLRFSPSDLFMASKQPQISHDSIITITAENGPFAVSNVTSTNAAFDINPKSFTLAAGESRSLTVTFTPIDSGYTWTEFMFETDRCPTSWYASGGFPGVVGSGARLVVDHPNGGEIFPIVSDTVITWSGVPPTTPVDLDYSIDNGATWIEVARGVSGGRYEWEVPNTPSDLCLVRARGATQQLGDSTGLLQPLPSNDTNVVAVWSPDGRRVATGGDDPIVRLWRVLGGSTPMELTGHIGYVLSLAFSPDGKLLASGGTDGLVILWDTETGTEVARLTGLRGAVTEIDWTPDGASLAAASFVSRFPMNSGDVVIWDVASESTLHQFPGFVGGLFHCKWSPAADRLAVSGEFPAITLINPTTGNIQAQVPIPRVPVGADQNTAVEFVWSPDGSRIYTAGGVDYDIHTVDAVSGTIVDSYAGHTNYTRFLALSPDGNFLATAGLDNRMRIWDIRSGAEVTVIDNVSLSPTWSSDGRYLAAPYGSLTSGPTDIHVWETGNWSSVMTFRGNRSPVSDLSWNPLPGVEQLLSGGYDGTARVWMLPQESSLEDQSDAVFSIVAPQLTAIDVDLGQVLVGESRDSVVSLFITNANPYVANVDTVRFSGASASLFSIVSSAGPYEVPGNASAPVEFRFAPTAVGLRTAQVLVEMPGGGLLLQTIRGEGVAPEVVVEDAEIDFGKVELGKSRDMTQQATIRNAGTAPITIDNVRHAGPNDVDFTTLAGGGSFTLQPGDTAIVDLRFSPAQVGRTSGRLLFDYDGPGSPATVILYGEGIDPAPIVAAATLATGEFYGEPGETITVPVRLAESVNVEAVGATGFRAALRFDASLLEPVGNTPAGVIQGGDRIIDLDLSTSTQTGDVLRELTFRIGLGRDSVASLTLENAEAIDGAVAMSVELGVVHILGICYEGGARLINPDGVVALRPVANTATSSSGLVVEMETIENGPTSLRLYDLHGREARTYIAGPLSPGRRLMVLEGDGLSAGLYLLVLQTPTERRSVMVEVRG